MSFYNELVHALNAHQVRFIIFGGFAVNFYGFSRYTADLDLWIDPLASNLDNLKSAMVSLGFEESSVLQDFISQKTIMLRLAEDFEKVDMLLKINLQKSFTECFNKAIHSESPFGSVHFIAYDDLLEEKIRSKRPKDLLDVDQLKTLRKDWNTRTEN